VTITRPSSGATISSTWGDNVTDILNGLARSTAVAATGTLSVSTSDADVPGCSISVTVTGNNAFALVTMVFDVQASVTTSNNVFLGRLNVDGVGAPTYPEAHSDDRTSRTTTAQVTRVPLAAGIHTVTLQASKTPGGSFTVMTSHTNLTVIVFDLP
jgi:hypothetical protein